MNANLSRAALIFILMAVTSCQSYYSQKNNSLSLTNEQREQLTARKVKVNLFTCVDPIIAEAVQNMFIAELAQLNLEIVREGDAEVVISGTITMTYDESMAGKSSSLGWGGVSASPQYAGGGFVGGGSGNISQSAGSYVSGISSLADFNGRIVASGSSSQRRVGGHPPSPPEELAKRAANDLKWKLQQAKSQRKITY